MPPVNNLSDEEYEFIAAAIEDEAAELELGDEYVLFTDYEGDGTFFPSVTILHHVDEGDDEVIDTITELLSEHAPWLLYDEVEIEERDGDRADLYFFQPRIRENVREKVEEPL